MKVIEFVDYMKKNTHSNMKDEQVISVAKKAAEVKSYLSIKNKKQLIDNIINECILFEDGVFKFDGIRRYVCFTMMTLEAYTNLELSADVEEDFDALSSAKLLPILVCMIQQEYDDVNILLQMQCDLVLEGNTVEAQIGKFLNSILDKVDGMGAALKDVVPSIVEKLDLKSIMENKEAIADFIKNIMN